MKTFSGPLLVFLSFGLTVAGCQPPAPPPSPVPGVTAPAVKVAAKSGWEQKWEAALAEGRKEGKVAIYNTGWPPDLRVELTRVFKEKYGIDLEFTPFSRGAELVTKVEAEKRASLHSVDIFGAGAPTLVATLKPKGLMGPIEPFLVLPEAMDPKAWSGGEFPFIDKDKLTIGMIAVLSRYILYNTNLVREGEITTYKDLLKPQYKGKMTLNDPTVTGAGQAFITHLIHDVWNLEEATEFLRQLVKQQEVDIQRDNRIHVESVARGKFPIGLSPQGSNVVEFTNLGAPIKVVINKEGTFGAYGAGALAVPVELAHPNAATVFINWVLSKEGQTVFSRAYGLPSRRTDVPTEGFLFFYVPQPGEKIFWMDEERIVWMEESLAISKRTIEAARQ